MMRRKIMKNEHQENGASRASLILTVPAYSFVVALHLDCLGRSNRAAFSAETFVDAADGETFETKDPALGTKITRVSPTVKQDVKQLAAAAREAFKKRWRTIAGWRTWARSG
jgi:hypothetical protein